MKAMSINKCAALLSHFSRLVFGFSGLFIVALSSLGQGTITFDNPPMPSGTATLTQRYDEAGMSFTPIGSVGFVRQGGVAQAPENGTTYLQALLGSTLQFSYTNGSSFNLVAVDLAEYSTVVPVLTVTFMGYRQDGSIVTTILTPDGVIDGTGPLADFQTFYFGPEFSNLIRVEIPTYGWSLDNLVVAVPEPGVGALVVVGIRARWFFRRRCRA